MAKDFAHSSQLELAYDRTASSNGAFSKLVKAWESKNSERAVRGAGLGLMALSLAACGGTDTPVAPVTPVAPTGQSLTLTTGSNILTSADFTTVADTITADQDTYGSADVIVEGTAGDGDTLTVSTDAAITATPTIVGIENINFDVTSFADVSIKIDGIADGTVTVNNLQVAGTTAAGVTGAGNVTVVAGSGVTGTLSVAQVDGASTIVNSGAAATVVVAAAGTAADQTITVVAAGDIDLKATGANTLAVSGAGNVTLNAASSDLATDVATVTGAAGQTLIVADSNKIDGANVSGFDLVQIDTSAAVAVNPAFDARNIASDLNITATAGVADTFTVASGASVTLDADVSAKFNINDDLSTTTLTTGVLNVTLSEVSVGTAGLGSKIVIDGAADRISTLNITADANQTAGALVITATTALTTTLAGAGNVAISTTSAFGTGSTLNASALAGDLTATASASLLSITGGSGDDVITALTAVDFDLAGGAGTDTLVSAADMTAGTFSGFEVLEFGNNDNFLSSQLNGLTVVATSGAATTAENINVTGGVVDTNTINLSGITFANAADGVDMTGATQDTSAILNGSAMTITGSNGADNLLGFSGADVISGGAGADVITGGAGADVLNGGAGVDTFVNHDLANNGTDTITDFATTVDKIQLAIADLNAITGAATFTAGTTGVVALGGAFAEFLNGAGDVAATGSAGTFIYNADTGQLIFDASGDTSYNDTTGVVTDTLGDDIVFADFGAGVSGEILATDFTLV